MFRSELIVKYLSLIILGAFGLVALFGPLIFPYNSYDAQLSHRLLPPDLTHWFGCDLNGGDVFAAVIAGTRTSLYVAFVSTLLAHTLGVFLGLIAGYFSGPLDRFVMSIVDLVMAFPGLLLALAISALLGPSLNNIIIALAATSWTGTARLIRGQVLSLSQRDFVQAHQATGASSFRTLYKEILPHLGPPLAVHIPFHLAGVILIESSLSFLGLGARADAPTWGALMNQGRSVLIEAPHLSFFPGLAIFILILCLNTQGEALAERKI